MTERGDYSAFDDDDEIILPVVAHRTVSPHLEAISEKAKDYARNAQSENTRRAYEFDWRQFSSWPRRQGLPSLPPDPQNVGLYLAASTDGTGAEEQRPRASDAGTTAFRHSLALSSARPAARHPGSPYRQVLAGIRRQHGKPPAQKEAIFADELFAMLATLDMACGACATAPSCSVGFAGGLRRSEIVGLDCGPDQSEDGTGWIEIFGPSVDVSCARKDFADGSSVREKHAGGAAKTTGDGENGSGSVNEGGLLLTINGKTGWREVEIGRGSRVETCPVALLERWMRLGRVNHGPLFRPVARKNGGVSSERLTDKHVARLVQKTAMRAGIRGDLTEGERKRAFGGHSLRAGLASSAQIEEAHVQKHLGHASAEMTRRYQRKRDRFKVNLTKAAGL